MPAKSQLGVSAASEIGYPSHTSSPDRGLRKRASSEADKYKSTPPTSYNTAMGVEQPPVSLEPPSPSPKHLSSSLDAGMASLSVSEPTEAKEEGGEQKGGEKEESGGTAEESEHRSIDREVDLEKEEETEEQPPGSTDAPTSSTEGDASEETVATSQHTGTMNGSLVAGQVSGLVPEMRCSVEQAEEIMGTEATGLGIGMGLGLGLGLADEARLEDYHRIPVDHAVAVECDEQVLGELDVAGFEEFSRRIYALNENMSSFRRPRKNSDK